MTFLGRRLQLSILSCLLPNSLRKAHHFKIKNKHRVDVGWYVGLLAERANSRFAAFSSPPYRQGLTCAQQVLQRTFVQLRVELLGFSNIT